MASVPIGQLANFSAGLRKPALKQFGLFSPNDNLGFIAGIGVTVNFEPVNLTGTIDGVNAVFTIPGTPTGTVAIFKNGVMQDPAVHYTLAVSTVTFNGLYIPQPGDDLQAIFS